jgi:lysophospholipase L1-like esterase
MMRLNLRFGPLCAGCAALIVWPCLILADTLTARAQGWTSQSRLEQAVVASCLLVIVSVIMFLVVPAIRKRLRDNGARIVLLVCGLSAGLLMGELLAGFTSSSQSSFHIRRPNLQVVSHPKPGNMPGIYGDSRYSTNSRGMRGPVWPSDERIKRILCVGGSTTECFYLDDQETWPRLLMKDLNNTLGAKCWVGDVGMSGYDTRHHLKYLTESRILDEVDEVIMLVGGNDFHRALQGNTEDACMPRGPRWSRSAILAIIRSILQQRPRITVEDEAGEVYEERRLRLAEMSVIDQLPDLDSALDAYLGRIESIARLCAEKHVRLICMTQPVLWRDDLPADAARLLWMGWTNDHQRIRPGALRRGLDRFNSALIAACVRLSVPCVDLQAVSGNVAWFYDDMHFNEAGAREVERLLFAGLQEIRTERSVSP